MVDVCPLCDKEFRYLENHIKNFHKCTLNHAKGEELQENFETMHEVRICSDLNYFVDKHLACIKDGMKQMYSDLHECVARSLLSLPHADDDERDIDDDVRGVLSPSCDYFNLLLDSEKVHLTKQFKKQLKQCK